MRNTQLVDFKFHFKLKEVGAGWSKSKGAHNVWN